jgi:hypothetical protein
MFYITLFTVGYTQDNINLDWYKISPVSAENLEMPQFELAEDDITTSDYSSPYSQSNNISKLLYEYEWYSFPEHFVGEQILFICIIYNLCTVYVIT